MKALSYLFVTKLKNRILMLKRKPALLILYLVIFSMIFLSTLVSLLSGNINQNIKYADERIIFLFIAGFGILFLVMYISTGLSTGSTLFTMADVGLLFVAPISTKKILLYGLINTMGKSLLASIFIFYQIGNLKINFGYGMKEILGLFFIFAIMVIFGQLLSIAVYIFSNGNPARKNMIKVVLYLSIGLLIVAALLLQRKEQLGIFEAVLRLINSPWFGYVPFAGWPVMFFKGVVEGSLLSVILVLIFFTVCSILIVSLLTMGKADYYEDVLLSTEVMDQKLRAAKEGRKSIQGLKKKVKVKEEDGNLLKGQGAMTLLYKHLLEMKRGSRFIFIDAYTIFVSVGVGIAGYNVHNIYTGYGVLAGIVYMQFFFTIFGRLRQ
ncbi:MAG TPA: putative ABC exporter domain-containing protein, partial [Mobilitalea sp.]|nr:putative ABC exporter domain-containing protein [Mobilitalea sp.]